MVTVGDTKPLRGHCVAGHVARAGRRCQERALERLATAPFTKAGSMGTRTTLQRDRLKLTEQGAEALKTWCARRGVTLVALGAAAGVESAMWARRLLRREGLATLEQVGAIVGFCGGEVTGAQLLGLDLAAAVPVVPLRPLRRIGVQLSGVKPATDAPARAEGELDEDGEPVPPTGSSRKTLEYLRDHARSQALKADCARRLLQLEVDEEAKHGATEHGAAVRDLDLLEKFQTLLHNARRQWEQVVGRIPAAAGAPDAAPADPSTPKTDVG